MNPKLDAYCCSESVMDSNGVVTNKEYVSAMWDVEREGLVKPDGSVAVVPFVNTNSLTGGSVMSFGDLDFSVVARNPILNGATAGQDSGWLPISAAPERFAYQLDSGSTSTTFSVDISADGVNSLGQAFTGTWASSSLAEITPPIMFSNPLAKFFRWNVVSGGPLSVSRGV